MISDSYGDMPLQGVCAAGLQRWTLGDSDESSLGDGPLPGAMIACDDEGLEGGAGD